MSNIYTGLPPNGPPNKRAVSGHRYVGFLYFSLLGLAVLIALVQFYQDYQNTRSEIEDQAEAYAVSMATDIRWYVNVAEQTLRRVTEQMPERNSPTQLTKSLTEAIGSLPAGVVIAIYNKEGESVAFLGQTGPPVSVADRKYFQDLVAGEPFVISNLISDRVTGKMTFAVGIPVINGTGDFQGAAVAYAPMEAFSLSWLSVGGTNSNAFIVHKDGWITARLPPVDSTVYDNSVAQSFVTTFFEHERGVYWAPASPIDGITRVLGYAQVPSTPLSAVIGISPDEAISHFWSRVFLLAAIFTPISVLLGILALRARSDFVQREETAAALALSNARIQGLLLEIHHRVKNNLQSALALVRLHVKDGTAIAEIEPRINAMVSAHEHIYRNDGFDEVSAIAYITDLARKTIYATSLNIELRTEIPNIPLKSELLMPLGQFINEAIINATKYGFPDARAGVIEIKMSTDPGGQATLTIYDNGNPLPQNLTAGIGSRLMAAFAAQLCGQFETVSDKNGVTVILTFPLAK